MNILVTGAAGFLGSRLVRALLTDASGLRVSRVIAADTSVCAIDDPRIESHVGTITDSAFLKSVAQADVSIAYHLAAIVSGQAESEFDRGMRVNLDATRNLLETCRRLATTPRLVFTSTVGVFGGPLPHVVPDDAVVWPQSSYGTAKAIAELLVNEYSRRRFIDGIIVRLPTIAIRPGRPNAALSSFVSGIIREPLSGRPSVCPVPLDTRLWISSPDVVIRNLVRAAHVDTSLLGSRRAVNLPGLCVTAGEMLASLERLGGPAVRARVECKVDDAIAGIVSTWPGALDSSRALRLGFHADRSIDDVVRQFMAETGASRDTRPAEER